MDYSIDTLTQFNGYMIARGWTLAENIEIHLADGFVHRVEKRYRSADVEAVHPGYGQARFEEVIAIGDRTVEGATVVMRTGDNVVVREHANLNPEHTRNMYGEFLARLPAQGRFLEVGSRARSGVSRRNDLPEGWSYTGMDIMPGENVDVVGDAHKLSRIEGLGGRYDAVMAHSVIEHILMPWKFALELNKVMNVGALGYFSTHQGWPLHDAPWDFWRFSDQTWRALFNQATGFRILDAAMGERAFVVPQHMHAVTQFGLENIVYLSSNVTIEKVGDTTLQWPVEVEDIVSTTYPATSGKL